MRVEVIQDPGIELAALGVSGPEFAFLGAQTPLSITVANLHGEVIGPFGVQVIASNSPDLTNPVTIHTSSITLSAFQLATLAIDGVFPHSLGEGLVYLGLIVDPNNGVQEFNETNNTASNADPVRLLTGAPDLAITRIVTEATSARAGDAVPVSVRVTNVGGEPSGDVTVAVVLSTNPVISPQDAELSRYTVNLDAGESDARDLAVTIPANASSGTFRIGLLADPENQIIELSESNNGVSTPTTIEVTGGPISIISTSLPVGYVRQTYIGLLNAVGGTATRNWSIVSGSLPTGLGLVAATGEIYGRPSREESATFTVQVESDNQMDTQVLTLEVVEPEQPLTIVSRSVPYGTVGQEYEFALVITGGASSSTVTWSGMGLPPGLEVSTDGVLRGTPTMAGDFTLSVSATDGSAIASRDLLLVVQDNTNLLIVPAALPAATYGMPYSFQITSTGGVEPITYIIELGALPAGLTLSTSGLISGTPMEVSSSPFRIVVEARDGAPGQGQAKDVNTFELIVNDIPGFVVSTEQLPLAYLNEGYTETVKATGGLEPYQWSVEGDLPPGLSASTNPTTNELLIAGQPTQLGLFTLTLKVIDSEGRSAGRALAIRVMERPVVVDKPVDDGGCGCHTAGSADAGSFGFGALLLLGALLVLRRR